MEDESLTLLYFAAVRTFNQKDKEKSTLLLFRSDIDTADQAVQAVRVVRVVRVVREAMKQPTTVSRDAHDYLIAGLRLG